MKEFDRDSMMIQDSYILTKRLYSTTKRFDDTPELSSRPKQKNQPHLKMLKKNSSNASVPNITFEPSLQANVQIQQHQNTSSQMI